MVKPTTILLVDDDRDDLSLFKEALKQIDNSIELIYADSGIDALRILRGENAPQPDYIFLDLNMPRMNGKECLAEIKKSPALRDIPVVICTTSTRQSDIDDTQKLGASSYVTKPMNFKDFVEAIQCVLEGRHCDDFVIHFAEVY